MLCVLMLMRTMSAVLSKCVVGNKADNIYARKQRRIQRHIKISEKAEEQNVEIKHPNVGDEIQAAAITVEFWDLLTKTAKFKQYVDSIENHIRKYVILIYG